MCCSAQLVLALLSYAALVMHQEMFLGLTTARVPAARPQLPAPPVALGR